MISTAITRTSAVITATIMAKARSDSPRARALLRKSPRKRAKAILPRKAGEGNRPKGGGGGISHEGSLRAARPLHHASHGPPPPRASRAGEDDDFLLGRAALYRLMAWLSPAYPIGAFSYSAGIEWAVEAGDITDAATLRAWLAVMIGEGGGFGDGVFFAHAHRAVAASDDAALRAVAELAAAFVPSKERFLETTAQGRAFLETTRAAWPCPALKRLDTAWPGSVALPVAVGVACAGHGIALESALHAFLHALAANWISAGVRLIPLGQTDGQRVLAALEPEVEAAAARALASALDEVGTCAFRADLAGMRHETQYTRLFRS
jgi:urease accessory protein